MLSQSESNTLTLAAIKSSSTVKNKTQNLLSKTKKNKWNRTLDDKSRIWDLFDQDKKQIQEELLQNQPASDEVATESDTVRYPNQCRVCESVMLNIDNEYPVCSNQSCGAICKETLDYSPEWRFYGADDKNANDPTRCGNPINPLLHESSFGCKVMNNGKISYEMRKIAKWTEWQSIPHKEKALYNEFMYISNMAQNAGIPKMFVDDALAIHKDISEQKIFRGCNRDGTKAASIYISCRLNGYPRTSNEIAEMFHLDKTSATHGCSLALNILNNIDRNNGGNMTKEQIVLEETMPSSFIDRYCCKLNITGEQTLMAKFVAKQIETKNLIPDNTPHSIAAGIIYFVCQTYGLNMSKSDIRTVCGVSEVTVNKCYKKLQNLKDKILPSHLR